MEEKQEAVFRSADMALVEVFLPVEIAREALYALGEEGLVQFRDLNSKVRGFQRTYVSELRRLDNVERQYRYFHSLLQKYGVPLYEDGRYEGGEQQSLQALFSANVSPRGPPSTSMIDDHVENANLLEERFQQMVEASEKLEAQRANLEEYRALLLAGDRFFADVENEGYEPLLVDADDGAGFRGPEQVTLSSSASYFMGAIPRGKVGILERVLWRTLRGNLFFRHVEMPNPLYDAKQKELVEKDAFIVFAHGNIILDRIKKIAESLDACLYEVHQSPDLRSGQLREINSQLNDLHKVLDTTLVTLEAGLYSVSKELDEWNRQVYKEKVIYQTLNLFGYDSNRKMLIAEGWVPLDEVRRLQAELQRVALATAIDAPYIVNVLETNRTPPTFHRTNKFTKAFQDICDCYGVASYQEVNPGLATIVTFPFMFAIMFGDMGHGILMTLAAAVLVFYEQSIGKMRRDEIFDMAYSGRYILLMMGLFSIYTGFLYNDMFSKSLTILKSGWKWPDSWKVGETIHAEQVGVYRIGIDHAWHSAENSLLFSNSLKMKLSIIMGVAHMLYSYTFSLANALYFNDMVDILCNFVPGLLFLCSIFGYLVICIIYKWTVDWIKIGKPAPSLLNTLINMFLSPGTIEEQLYPGQATVQLFLLFVALICIPWLLLAKPLHFKFTHDKYAHQPLASSEYNMMDVSIEQASSGEEMIEVYDDDSDDNDHGENLGDVVIHQVIHTIEWCLNCVSHTASYLRLWALSLAHAQLSTVLWNMTIKIAFGMNGTVGVIMTVVLFAMWFVLTCVILVVMEGTSAMLHSLRLHWVESMSKFFKGEGTSFEPFVFNYLGFEESH
ncbi:ADR177Cp [Eremothecium gossypii ATCC 10895]|uniref:V-type proton ATPase subunit a n=1 Tax=Eremothecium gossypii (strain ATCC 10895 / CBS 109.51 / FGSC 9923 / NRRL Y-1056) TaxID=284811 RepID=Q759U6_EREGS|nr:ADR177Cp [Eremothecium gossypii ATCC 10895]AAS52097.2 ADR177Cp [Eremothecium gossypii ATCC 10895]AEY96396.1 FADR177Cp [Eremothecium gossypii FDAG1]